MTAHPAARPARSGAFLAALATAAVLATGAGPAQAAPAAPASRAASAALASRAAPADGVAAASAASGSPATLVFQAEPAIRGVGVNLDGSIYRTGANGTATIATTSGQHHIRILLPRSVPPGTTIRFGRWADGISLAGETINVRRGIHTVEAGFIISRPISIRFTDEHGASVPMSEISRITITNGLGQRFTFPPGRPPHSLAVNRISKASGVLLPVPVRYAVRSVIIDGADVVFNGGQRFYVPDHLTPWTVRVLLFPLKIQVRDAMFKFGVGTEVKIVFPNGTSRVIPLKPNHTTVVTRLPRGNYKLAAHGPGMGFTTPVALSAPQSATLLMLSWLDVLAVAAFAVLFLIGLPVAGGRIRWRPGQGHRPAWQARPARNRAAARTPAVPERAAPARWARAGSNGAAASRHAGPGLDRVPPAEAGPVPAASVGPASEDAAPAARGRGRRRRP